MVMFHIDTLNPYQTIFVQVAYIIAHILSAQRRSHAANTQRSMLFLPTHHQTKGYKMPPMQSLYMPCMWQMHL